MQWPDEVILSKDGRKAQSHVRGFLTGESANAQRVSLCTYTYVACNGIAVMKHGFLNNVSFG